MLNATSENITYAKGKVGGMAFRAPLGTSLPSDATTDLGSAWENVGHISDEGLAHGTSWTTNETKSWDGTIVKVSRSDKKEEFKFTMIEALRTVVIKTVRGDGNVSGSLATGLEITGNSSELEGHSWVFEEILDGGALKRTVVPNGEVTSIDEVAENGKNAVAYRVTLAAMPDSDGNTFKEYIYAG